MLSTVRKNPPSTALTISGCRHGRSYGPGGNTTDNFALTLRGTPCTDGTCTNTIAPPHKSQRTTMTPCCSCSRHAQCLPQSYRGRAICECAAAGQQCYCCNSFHSYCRNKTLPSTLELSDDASLPTPSNNQPFELEPHGHLFTQPLETIDNIPPDFYADSLPDPESTLHHDTISTPPDDLPDSPSTTPLSPPATLTPLHVPPASSPSCTPAALPKSTKTKKGKKKKQQK